MTNDAPDEPPSRWRVMRQDDNGNDFESRAFDTEAEARAFAKMLEDRGHKQMYWVEPIPR